ncbi:hypothetical protein [Nesterenkonia rhizosphaerae]|uniref:Uncharacterized protein n=1 Tax=Nesterenkonia rhizosphaerae TaxID=1348272 RepID=A0ABP9FX88_9MICC
MPTELTSDIGSHPGHTPRDETEQEPVTQDDAAEAEDQPLPENAVERFIAEHVQPRRHEFRSAEQLPSAAQLLGTALARRRIEVRKIVEGRWAFYFAGTVIGGLSHGLTTLVSAHARRVLGDPEALRGHLKLMDIPCAEEDTESSGLRLPSGLQLRGFVVGRELASMLALIPPYEYDDAVGGPEAVRLLDSTAADSGAGLPQVIAADVTELVSEDISSLAVDAVRAVPGLFAAGVDLEVFSLDSLRSAVVLDVDESADLLPHHVPTLGPGRDVADAIAEQILISAAL